tara:strand:+ start:189 stop:410 length:222 start_codon:yes stop_codon:yes gene_type:complete
MQNTYPINFNILTSQERNILLRSLSIFKQKNKMAKRKSERESKFPPEGRANIYDVNDEVATKLHKRIKHAVVE